jgi:polar amino acid transport system permease protein
MRTFGSPEFLFIFYALRWTLTLTVIAFVGGGLVGIALAVMRISSSKALRVATSAYMQFVQGLPLLILMFICYYAPSLFGFEVSAIAAAAVALTINSSAFLGAIWESALRAIPNVGVQCQGVRTFPLRLIAWTAAERLRGRTPR